MVAQQARCEDRKRIELMIAYYLAPVITGIKPSSFLAVATKDLKSFESVLKGFHIQMVTFREEGEKSYVLFYHPQWMEEIVRQSQFRQMFESYGYCTDSFMEVVKTLRIRYEESRQSKEKEKFPHEMGAVLGYPMEDVKGFIRNRGKNERMSGYWKVYGDVCKAQVLFMQYDKARKELIDYVKENPITGYPS